MKIAELM